MTNNLQRFEDVFPEVKGRQLRSKEEVFELAKRVADAMKRERARLVKEEQENNIASRFFSITSA